MTTNTYKVGEILPLKKEVHVQEINHDIESGQRVIIIDITKDGYDIETVDEGIQAYGCDWDIFSNVTEA